MTFFFFFRIKKFKNERFTSHIGKSPLVSCPNAEVRVENRNASV